MPRLKPETAILLAMRGKQLGFLRLPVRERDLLSLTCIKMMCAARGCRRTRIIVSACYLSSPCIIAAWMFPHYMTNSVGRLHISMAMASRSIFITARAAGFLSNGALYNYGGQHLGWLVEGWVRDQAGRCVFFMDDSTGGPARPARTARPARGARQARPARGARQAAPAMPARVVAWSSVDGPHFFGL